MSADDFAGSLQVRENAVKARIFNPRLARFTQPDTIIPGAGNPQAFNRYAYVLNNPVNYTDPSGHFCEGGYVLDGFCVNSNSTPGQSNSYTKYETPKAASCDLNPDLPGCRKANTPKASPPAVDPDRNRLLLPQYTGIEHPPRSSSAGASLKVFWDFFADPFIELFDTWEFHKFNSKGGWKLLKWSLPTGPIEAAVAAIAEHEYSDNLGMSPGTSLTRAFIKGTQAFYTDAISSKIAGTLGGAAMKIPYAGPAAGPIVYLLSSTGSSWGMEKLWDIGVNSWLIP